MFVSRIPLNQVCVYFNLIIRVHCIEYTNRGLCASPNRISQQVQVRFGCFETCY